MGKGPGPAVADVLFIAAVIAFFAVMLALVLLYDRSVSNGIYEAPGAAEEANGRDERVAHPV